MLWASAVAQQRDLQHPDMNTALPACAASLQRVALNYGWATFTEMDSARKFGSVHLICSMGFLNPPSLRSHATGEGCDTPGTRWALLGKWPGAEMIFPNTLQFSHPGFTCLSCSQRKDGIRLVGEQHSPGPVSNQHDMTRCATDKHPQELQAGDMACPSHLNFWYFATLNTWLGDCCLAFLIFLCGNCQCLLPGRSFVSLRAAASAPGSRQLQYWASLTSGLALSPVLSLTCVCWCWGIQ